MSNRSRQNSFRESDFLADDIPAYNSWSGTMMDQPQNYGEDGAVSVYQTPVDELNASYSSIKQRIKRLARVRQQMMESMDLEEKLLAEIDNDISYLREEKNYVFTEVLDLTLNSVTGRRQRLVPRVDGRRAVFGSPEAVLNRRMVSEYPIRCAPVLPPSPLDTVGIAPRRRRSWYRAPGKYLSRLVRSNSLLSRRSGSPASGQARFRRGLGGPVGVARG